MAYKYNHETVSFMQRQMLKMESKDEINSPEPSRKSPSRHENGTTVSACAKRSLAFS
jgi:hypothetical protein